MIGNALQIISLLYKEEDKTKQYELREYKPKRTLTQNAYMWSLINEIANVMRKSKEEVYLQMLIDYSQSEIVSVLAEVNVSRFFKYFVEVGEGQVNGKLFKHYKVYLGSSEMDTKEMTILTDGVIQEAQNLGISTLTPNQLAELRSLENEKQAK